MRPIAKKRATRPDERDDDDDGGGRGNAQPTKPLRRKAEHPSDGADDHEGEHGRQVPRDVHGLDHLETTASPTGMTTEDAARRRCGDHSQSIRVRCSQTKATLPKKSATDHQADPRNTVVCDRSQLNVASGIQSTCSLVAYAGTNGATVSAATAPATPTIARWARSSRAARPTEPQRA